MSKYRLVEYSPDMFDQWNKFVEQLNNRTFFHRLDFLQYHRDCFKENENHLVWLKGDSNYAVMPFVIFEENGKIKDGSGDELWEDSPHKRCHKDIDACWTKKNGTTYYRYKNHVEVDTKSKFIDSYKVTNASVHDSQVLDDLLHEKDLGQPFYAANVFTGVE